MTMRTNCWQSALSLLITLVMPLAPIWADPNSSGSPKGKTWADIYQSAGPSQTAEPRALLYLVDKSRSMAQCDNLKAVVSALPHAFDALRDSDSFGIIAFDSSPFVVTRLDSSSVNKAVARKRLPQLFPATSTNLLPALTLTINTLHSFQAPRRRLLIITDTKIHEPSSDICREVERGLKLNIDMHLIGVGCEGDTTLMGELRFCGLKTHPVLQPELSTLLERLTLAP